MAKVASKCEYEYGPNGAAGYRYDSVKDNLTWNKLQKKRYTHLLMRVGDFMAMDEYSFKKASVENNKMKQSEIATALIKAFGDGR